jgi:capsular polysaccharide biosynthesis protein
MDLRAAVRAVFKRFWVLPTVMALSLAAGLFLMSFFTPVYEAEVQLLVSGTPRVESPFYNDLSTTRQVDVARTHGELLKSRDFLQSVVLALGKDLTRRDERTFFSPTKRRFLQGWERLQGWAGIDPVEDAGAADPTQKLLESLEKRITVEATDRTDVVNVAVWDYDRRMAERIGNALAYVYVIFNLKRQAEEVSAKYGDLHPLSMQLSDSIVALYERLLEFDRRGKKDVMAGHVKITQHASAPLTPKSPRRSVALAACLAGGFLGGLFLIFFLDYADPTYKSADDLRNDVDLPFLGAVPQRLWRRRWLFLRPANPEPEALLSLAHQIQRLRAARGASTVNFVAADYHRSNPRLIQLLARSLAQINAARESEKPGNALLVESGLNGDSFSSVSKAAGGKRAGRAISGAENQIRSVDKTLSVVEWTSGGEPRARAFEGRDCRSFLDFVKSSYDLVLLHGPAAGRMGGSILPNLLADATVLIVNEQHTRKKALRQVLRTLEVNQVKVLGVILNNQRHYIPGFVYKLV